MNATDLLNQLTQQGIHLWAEGDKLKFRAPKGALTAEQRTLLKGHKAEILQALSEPKLCPVSFAQQRLWFLYQMEPDNPFYNIPLVFELIGDLDPIALTRTLNEIVRRHETLRTTFSMVEGEPVQVIAPHQPFAAPLVDLQTLPEAEQAAEAQQHLDAEIEQPFDLGCGPLIRFKLLRLTETHHRLLLTMHHIIADGWSVGVLYREMSALYEAFVQSRPSPLPELPLQYADFSQWQRAWFQGERAEAQLAYWQKQLAEPLPILELPTDHPRPPVQTFRGKWHLVTMPRSLQDSLKMLSRQENATLFMTLLAAFKILLYRYTQQTDISVGMPIANRIRADIEPLIGFFVNTLVIRSDLSNTPTFRELLQGVRQTALDAQAHQDLPFEKLVEVLQPDRNLSHTPLFQVMFSLQNTAHSPVELPGLTLEVQIVDDGSAKFDLFLALTETEAGLQARFQYNIDLFEAETIERMAGHYQTLLAGIIAKPDAPIDHLPLLTEAEHQQLAAWNETEVVYPTDQCVHHLVETQAERTPDAIAVLFPAADEGEAQTLTYRALNEQANQLAHHLQRLGVGPNQRVGLCLERSPEMTVGLLAILKAGAAYVPLDPNYPQERLAFMLTDAEVSALLTQKSLLNHLPHPDAPIICLDRDQAQLAQWPTENVAGGVDPTHPAYIIYTSGSTGRPKGVVMGHRPLFNLIRWQLDQPGFAEPTRTLQFTSLNFDVSFQEIFATWSAGGTLVLIPDMLRADSHALVRYLNDHHIQRLFLPFVALHHLAMAVNVADFPLHSLRHVITAGEQLKITPDIAAMFSRLMECQLHNHYGPTESHVVTAFTLAGQVEQWPNLPPIGRPIANTQIHLLDAHQQPVPIGIPAELYIGGVCLADGYLNRPELTAERFVTASRGAEARRRGGDSSPLLPSTPAPLRLYKTGDLARYLPDGNIEFLGRIDHQVKIRGFRVELGEIETLLSQHPVVEKCVVVAREDTPGDKRLVAYMVGKPTANNLQPTADGSNQSSNHNDDPLPISNLQSPISNLRDYLKARLPDYMIPAAFVELETLPINPNGKVDRRALPVPDTTHFDVVTFVPPEGQVEAMLAEAWQTALGLDHVGRHDNFFNLGGHSLLAMRVMARLQQEYEIELPLRHLFEQPTIAELASVIEAMLLNEVSEPGQGLHNGRQAALAAAFPQQTGLTSLTPGQEGVWYTEQLRPGSAAYNMPRAWRIHGPLDVPALERSLNLVIQRHDSLRTGFAVSEGQPRPVTQPTLTMTINKTDLQALPTAEREQQANEIVRVEANRPFDLAQAPLLRAGLVQLGPETFILTITMHHIIGDGWSVGILTQELAASYAALTAGRVPALSDLPLQYADFVRWEQARRQTESFATHLAYWQQQLADAPPVLELPTDEARPAVPSYAGDQVSLTLPPALAQSIQKLSQENNVTLFMTLLTAFKILLHRYTAQNNIIVGSPIIHRPLPELESLIGYFLNNLVLHTDLSGKPTFQALLAKVRRISLDAYTHQDVPYETLVQSLQSERDLSYNPLFQVAFNLFTTREYDRLDLTGLNVETLSRTAVEAHSKFDLTLYTRRDGTDIRFYLVYRTDLFRRERMVEMLAQYQHLLAQIVADPSQSINAYSLVTPAARVQLPDPTTPMPEPPQPLVTDLVADWAEKTPQQTAVSQGNQSWSYREVVDRADLIARSLTAMGVTPGDVVAIYAPRQLGLIVSMMATLASGGVFVLIDPFLPDERQRTLLQEAQARWLISVQADPDTPLDEGWLAEDYEILGRLSVEGVTGQVLNGPATDLTAIALPAVNEDDPAYIFFTSGSTGQPKGILGCHKGLSHFVRWQGEQFEVGPADRVAQLIGLSFDAILRDVFLPLTRGATLCLPDVDGLHLAEPLAWFQEAAITILHTVPALAQTWLATGAADTKLPNLRCAFFSGEPLTDSLVNQWRAIFPHSHIVNLYGPTETTMVKCYYPIPDAVSPGVQAAGYPMPQTQALVLADNNRLCGLNEPGEIVLRTPFRTLGYINAPEEAAKRFQSNPFRDDPADLLYYTGDLGCYRPDGTLAILGRLDDQVKVRGVRIELGEIIATLAQHPTVQANTVIAKKDEQGQNHLVAYVVPKAGTTVDVSAWRSYLSETLTQAMVPATFVQLERLPLLPTGKVDRRQLPEPELTLARSENNFIAPDGPVEEMLAEIWQELLNLERLSIHDNFFELGGHSLLAIQVVSRLRDQYDLHLPLRRLFELPTIAELAAELEEIILAEADE